MDKRRADTHMRVSALFCVLNLFDLVCLLA